MVQHPVDDNGGDRHIEPYGERQAGDPPVLRKLSPQSPIEHGQREGWDCRREDGMRDQDREVDRASRALARERGKAGEVPEDQIADQKERETLTPVRITRPRAVGIQHPVVKDPSVVEPPASEPRPRGSDPNPAVVRLPRPGASSRVAGSAQTAARAAVSVDLGALSQMRGPPERRRGSGRGGPIGPASTTGKLRRHPG